jgi:prepilin-type N-terminal cleavage/methylation domain-containing protein
MSARRRQARRGYTFVELLMSLMIFAIGVTGVIAMQKVTVTSNQHARDLVIATQVAQAFMDQLRADAVSWNQPSKNNTTSTDLATDTVWLNNVAASNVSWILPAYSSVRKFGPAFDVQGQPVDMTLPGQNNIVKYCTHIRLSWLYNPLTNPAMIGNGLIRTEVRVFWLRDGQTWPNNQPICGAGLNPNSVAADASRYHFVYNVSAVRENMQQ